MNTSLPGWLLKRARDVGGAAVHVLIEPATEVSPAAYLLEINRNCFELHVVANAASGIDGETLPLTRSEAFRMLTSLAGALTGRESGVFVPSAPLAPAGVLARPSQFPEPPIDPRD
jgi:hypothetical protein